MSWYFPLGNHRLITSGSTFLRSSSSAILIGSLLLSCSSGIRGGAPNAICSALAPMTLALSYLVSQGGPILIANLYLRPELSSNVTGALKWRLVKKFFGLLELLLALLLTFLFLFLGWRCRYYVIDSQYHYRGLGSRLKDLLLHTSRLYYTGFYHVLDLTG